MVIGAPNYLTVRKISKLICAFDLSRRDAAVGITIILSSKLDKKSFQTIVKKQNKKETKQNQINNSKKKKKSTNQ